MSKIPVMATASRANGFLLGDIATIVRLAWAPILIGAGLSYVYGPQIMDATIAAKDSPDALAALLPMQLLIFVVTFVTGIMATVALLRVVILGDRKPGLFVYLWLGAAELRIVLVTVLLVIAFIAALFAGGLVFALLGAMAAAVPGMDVLVTLALFGMVLAVAWAALRLSLVSPVIVAENNLGVERSWQLMSGNVFRMILVLILTLLPYMIAASVAGLAVLGADFPALPAFPNLAGADAAAVQAAMDVFRKALEQWQLDLTKAMRVHYAELSALGFVGNFVYAALAAGAFGNAYNAVTDHQAGR